MKIVAQVVLWILSGFFCYMIYKSVSGPLEFKKLKEKRYAKVVRTLKDIRNSEEAYKTVNGKYTGSFDTLVTFIETGEFTLTSQRDTSWTEYDKAYAIDVLKEGKIIDTIGTVSVKDSLFKKSDRYKKMMFVPYTDNKKFDLEAATIIKNNYSAPVFLVKANKEDILADQPADLVEQEKNSENITEDITGPEILVGSLDEVSTNGNWPTIYDAKTNKK
ncbi:hypothetical protein NBRC110019_08970 [Neptunitalea chrysea]|uniref:Uncharacterized protein n=1 Tax=Neptunitalea chrysea TaxID=1647581 RepID=A0A9W6B3G8_9FLAO|nr:hypothetical protein [Neptunitalea chrysea]GLB51858.1 hypothetical protein NBRC110019_08970 [Neptunitalea chrysea]